MGDASVRHDRFYVCKVHIDQSKIGNQIGYTLNALSEHVVSHVERLQHGRILLAVLKELVIGNNNERVHVLFQEAQSQLGLVLSLFAFKRKRLGHYAYGQDSKIFGSLGDDRSSSRTRAASHTCGDKHHIRALKKICNFIESLLGGPLSDFRITSRSQSSCKLFAYLNFGFCLTSIQSLLIRIDCDKLYSF